jgi:DNA-binding response OmpR family regulator
MRRILVVDDEPDLCDILSFNLRGAGYEVDVAYSADEALAAGIAVYDLLLLDVMMPGTSGFELAARLKHDGLTARVPIIFLTALDTEDDTLQGFHLGADDYISKPFSVREVLARVKAVLSRSYPPSAAPRGEILEHRGLAMNPAAAMVTADGSDVVLTKTEFDLLRLLLTHRGQLFSRHEILEKVWPRDVVVTERTVDVNITRLRKKLGAYAACIVNRPGFGYGFDAEANAK